MTSARGPLSIPGQVWLQAGTCATLVSAVLLTLTQVTPLFDRLEYWAADWRTAYLTHRRETQHPSITVVTIDENTLLDYPAYSPLDRQLLARLITALDAAEARVIGLDITFDKKTSHDAALLEAIKTASHAQIVLGIADGRSAMADHQRQFQESFLDAAGRPYGYFGALEDIDRTVRTTAPPPPDQPELRSFAETVAFTAGVPETARPNRIAWLQDPAYGEAPFATIPADVLLNSDPNIRAFAKGIVAGRIVLIGGTVTGTADWHFTPLSTIGRERTAGVMINAHIVAQLLDGRSYREVHRPWDIMIAFALAFVAFVVGWRWGSHWLLDTGLVALGYVIQDGLIFYMTDVILPYTVPALAWLLAIYAGRYISSKRIEEVSET